MFLSSFAIILIKQLTLSVTGPFALSPAVYYVVHCEFVTMRLSCTVMEIWHLKRWTHARTLK